MQKTIWRMGYFINILRMFKMGQAEIISYMEKHKDKWFTMKELKKQFNVQSVATSIKKLTFWGFIITREVHMKGGRYRTQLGFEYKFNSEKKFSE